MIEISHLGLDASLSLALYSMFSCESQYLFSSAAGEAFSDDDQIKHRSMIGLILLLCSVSRTVVFEFSRFMDYLVSSV